MKYILALLVATTLAASAHGQAHGVKLDAQAFTINLPNDIDKPFVTLIGHPEDPRYNAVRQWFENNDSLRSLKAHAHYNELPTTSAMYRERYATTAPASFPAVRVQSADGTVISEFAGQQIPLSAEALGRGIGSCFRSDSPPQAIAPPPQAIAPPPPPAEHHPYLLLAILIAAGAIAGLHQSLPKGTK